MDSDQATILVVDDVKNNIDMVLDILGDDYDFLVAKDGETAMEIAAKEKINLFLLDIVMPGMNGYQLCQHLKQMDRHQDTPVIFITAKSDEESIEKGFDVGGVDYVTKPFKNKELKARVKTHIQQRRLINHLEYVSSHDTMTGLFNRGKFFELANKRLATAREDLYAIMIDVDNFKAVNDTWGHSIGDRVLQEITATINSKLGQGAIFGRLGGEEFAVLMNGATDDEVYALLESAREETSKLRIRSESGDLVTCTFSAGVSKPSSDTSSVDALLRVADDALYEAKRTGRNRSVFRRGR